MNRIKAILLLFTFSVTLVGYNMEVHYCGDEITDVSIVGASHCVCDFVPDLNCEESCDSHGEEDEKEHDDCCKTEKVQVEIDNVYSYSQISIDQIIILNSIFEFNIFQIGDEIVPVTETYSTPLFYQDIPILIQSFLI